MDFIKAAYPAAPSGNVLSFLPVSEGSSVSVYGSAQPVNWAVRFGGAQVASFPTRSEAEALATEMAEAVGDIVYEVPVT